ncbi:MAG: PLDc N-terminal domain-containing protein, partial [Nocardioides sp.]
MNDIATLVSAGAFVVVIDLAIRLLALVIIPRDRLPTAAMAWLLAVFFIPVIGVLLFLLIGNPKLPEKRQLKQREMDAVIARESRTLTAPSAPQEWPVWLEPVVTLTQTLTQMPLVGGNSALLLDDYEGSLAAMATEIDAATSYVHVEFYIFSLDATTAPFFESLEAAVR